MCGIVGIVGRSEVAPRMVDSLRRLEYRGYDSAGIATLVGGAIDRRRAEGKLKHLSDLLGRQPLPGLVGIGHTRWATHGAPTEVNAHPHATRRVAVVHNGIIENFRTLRDDLAARGHVFQTETDSEAIAHLITDNLERGLSPEASVEEALRQLHGAFALGIIFAGEEDLLIGARRGSPLAIGFGEGESYLGSDALALAPLAHTISYLDEGDWAILHRHGGEVRDAFGTRVERPVRPMGPALGLIDKGNHRHFMLKEIHEQPAVIGDTLACHFDPATRLPVLPDTGVDLAAVKQLTIVACGTSSYAALVAKYWFEQIARIRVEVDIASEFRYREAPLEPGGLAIFVSQSGETADTLAALRYAKAQGQYVASVVNVPESSMARESHLVLATHAGPEIGVASTKAFTCQMVTLACLALAVGQARGALDASAVAALSEQLSTVPSRLAEILDREEEIADVSRFVAEARDVLYLGRGNCYPLALEGALKLKEISYIHAEGYAAGEMKHGPIALIDPAVPVVVIAPSGPLFEKTMSNTAEVLARGGKVVLISDAEGIARAGEVARTIEIPAVPPFIAPIVCAVPVQLLAYHAAVVKGTDVDQPRNLAKSVTVE